LGGGLYAVIVSTTMIVIFGEIIPQAVSSVQTSPRRRPIVTDDMLGMRKIRPGYRRSMCTISSWPYDHIRTDRLASRKALGPDIG
jgi:hypothetical protein